MKVLPINYQSKTNYSPAFKANLWVDTTVNEIIKPNKENFLNAAKKFDTWLRNDKGNIAQTLHIRKNTSLIPNMVFRRFETEITYAYPFEESGYCVTRPVEKYEDLEFELGSRKCGFWFDPASNVDKLFTDFKNMFNYLHNG